MSKRREEGLNSKSFASFISVRCISSFESFDEESSINGVIDEIITGCEPVRMWTDGCEPTDVNRRNYYEIIRY